MVVKIPELEVTEEIRSLVVEWRVTVVRCLTFLVRTLARVLELQRRGDHKHLGKTILLVGRENNAADTGIDRQAAELPPPGRQLTLRVDGTNLVQRPIPIAHRFGARWVKERKIFHVAQLQ